MITAINIATAPSSSAWFNSHAGEAVVSLRVFMTGTGLIRLEGRNLASGTAIPLGLMYATGTMLVPRFNQYRVVVIGLDGSSRVDSIEIGPSVNDDEYGPVASSRLFNRSRTTPKGLRKGGFRTTHVCSFELLASGTTRAADGATKVTSAATAEKDYTNCRSGEVQSGESQPYSIKVTTPTSTTAEFSYDYRVSSGGSGPIDLSGGTNEWPFILLRVYVDPSQHAALQGNVGTITIGFADTANNQGNVTIANFQQFLSSAVTGPGWNTVVVHPTTVGSVDPADVHLIRVYIAPKSGTSCAITLDTLQFLRPTTSTKLVAFRDDDGYSNCVLTAKEFDKWGIRGNFHVHPRLVGTSGFVSKADLLAMQKSGHMIGNHGWSKYPGDDLNDNANGPFYKQRENTAQSLLIDHIRPATWWLQDNGFEQGARIYATHQGNLLPEQADLLLETDIDVISHTSTAGENATTTNHLDYLEVQHATGYSAISASLLAALDAHGGLAVFYGHANRSQENAFMKGVTDAVVPKLKDGTYKCVTLAELVNGVY
jgi:hypothetical protein